MKQHTLISIDLAKNVFQVCGMTQHHKVAFNKQLTRKELPIFIANHPPVEIAMEACYSRGAFPFCRWIREVLLAAAYLRDHTQMPAINPERSW